MKNKLWLFGIIALAFGALFVSAADVVTTCTFISPTSGEIRDNSTVVVIMESNSPYVNSTTGTWVGLKNQNEYMVYNTTTQVQNLSSKGRIEARFPIQNDGTYYIGGRIALGTNSSATNYTSFVSTCTNQSFIIDTQTGSGIVYQVQQQEVVAETAKKNNASTILIILALVGVAVYLIGKKK